MAESPFTLRSSPVYYIYMPARLISKMRDVALLLIKFYVQLKIQAAAWTQSEISWAGNKEDKINPL